MMKEGDKVIWNPFDDSEESYAIGQILFGEQQYAIRDSCRKNPVPSIIGTVTKVDPVNSVISIDLRPNR